MVVYKTMETIYTIDGVKKEGNKVRLVLNNNVITEKPSLFDIGKLQQQMTYQTMETQNPDRLRISLGDWSKHQLNIGDSIKVTIEVL